MATTDRNIRLLEDSEADIPTATNDAIEDINRELHEVEAVAEAGPDWNEIQNIPTEFPPSAHTHTKGEVGLANVDNTADLDKPISTATQTALGGKADLVSGMLKASQIPLEILGALRYQTGWNAATNTPNIAAGDVFKGYYWIVTTPGATSLGGITDWQTGDHAVYDGTGWTKYDYSQVVYTAANVAAIDSTGGGATVLQDVLANLFTAIGSKLSKASNLSDLTNVPQARTNLGLGSAAVESADRLVPAATATTYTMFPCEFGADYSNTQTSAPTANRIYVTKHNLLHPISAQRICWMVTTASSGGLGAIAIYSEDGNTKLLDSGAFSVNATGSYSNTFAATLLLPGTYCLAWSMDNAVARLGGFPNSALGTHRVAVNLGAYKIIGQATNNSAAGVMPTTLGTITENSNPGIPIVVLKSS